MKLNSAVRCQRPCSVFVLMMSRRFPLPWSVDRPYPDSFVVGGDGPLPRRDAEMVVRAQQTDSDEAKRIVAAIARIPATARLLRERAGRLSLEHGSLAPRRIRGQLRAGKLGRH